ncbi:MAG: tetratricopeptide repeat protein [Planctomycetota bacterium]|nr:tetratricopeptide repeat protein [Planctomycetota bacterium]
MAMLAFRPSRSLWLLLLACAGAAPLARAGAVENPDVAPLLSKAHDAWQQADELKRRARKQLLEEAAGQVDPIQLLQDMERADALAEEAYWAALKLDAQHPRALAEFGRFLASRERFAEATLRLDLVLDGERGRAAFLPPERADLLRTLGGTLERGGQTRRAVERYREAAKLNPDDPRNALSLGVALCVLGQHAEARREFDALLTRPGLANPHRALAAYQLAYVHEMLADPERALALYQDARKLAEGAGAQDLAGVCEIARLAERRVRRLVHAFKAQPEERERYRDAAHLFALGQELKRKALADHEAFEAARAELLKDARREDVDAFEQEPLRSFQEAMVYFQIALDAHPKFAPAQIELGLSHFALARLEDSRTHLEAAALYDPLSPRALTALGEVRMLMDDWEGAAESFTKLMSVDPQYGPAHLGLARALAKLHRSPRDCSAALDALDRAAQLGADPLVVRSLRQPVREMLAALERGEKVPPSKPHYVSPEARLRAKKQAHEFTPWQDSILDD